jgi:Skp family chaperone for outer membrane proteins
LHSAGCIAARTAEVLSIGRCGLKRRGDSVVKTGIWLGASVAAAGLLGAGMLLSPVHADGEGKGPPVYVINVKKVFDASPRFKAEAETLKAEMQKKEEDLRTLQNALQAKAQQREKFKGGAEREQIDKQINDMQFDFKAKQVKYREDLSKAESAAVGSVYREMTSLLSQYCKENRIYIVMRLDEASKEMPDDMQVMTLMNRQVIYNHPNLDLTDVISQGMMQAGGAKPAGQK